MESPVPLITTKQDGSFAVSTQAEEILQGIEGNLGVICVAGLYRTGKSYILNRLAGSSKGFSIGSFVEPCTQGMHMRVVPKDFCSKHLKTGGMSVILLDTEGLGSYKRGQNHDVKIFALALLLASTFVYNSMGSIDEGALDRLSYPAFFCSFLRFFRDKKRKKRPVDPRHSRARLSPARPHPRDLIPAPPSLPPPPSASSSPSSSYFLSSFFPCRRVTDFLFFVSATLVAELSNRIKMQAGAAKEDEYQLSRFFPKFVWMCRDFHLKLESGGNPITPTEYLENALKPLQGEAERVKSKNQIRQSICTFFTDRTCFVLRRPVADEKQLQHLEDIQESELRPQFLEGVQEFLGMAYSTLQQKTLFGEVLNGRMFAQLAKSYVAAINEGGVPVIRSAWDNVVETECQRTLEIVFAAFEQGWAKEASESREPVEETELEKSYFSREREAVASFRATAMGAATFGHEEKLIAQMHAVYSTCRAKNYKTSAKMCEGILEEIHKFIEVSVAENERTMTMEQLAADWENSYLPQARGPAKFEVLARSLRKRLPQNAARVSKTLVKAAKEEAEKSIKASNEKQAEEIKRIEKLYDDVKANWVRSKEEVASLAAENSKLLGLIEKFGDLIGEADVRRGR